MADWRKVAIAAFLADGQIDDNEVKVLKKQLYADGKIDTKEREFLVELRAEAQKKAKGEPLSSAFETFYFKALFDGILDNGIISAKEVTFLRKAILEDGKVDEGEKAFMKKLKKAATKVPPAFEKLYEEVVGK
jgi:uncharacterized membrane protein YebE (DUF533 family)